MAVAPEAKETPESVDELEHRRNEEERR